MSNSKIKQLDLKPVKLNKKDIERCLNALPTTAGRARRFFLYLAQARAGNFVVTGELNRECGIGNLSEVSGKLNIHLENAGIPFFTGAVRPPTPIKSIRFKERTHQHYWQVFKAQPEQDTA